MTKSILSVQDIKTYSTVELLYKLANQTRENTAIIEYLVNNGVSEEVLLQLNKMVDDGKFNEIIGEKLLKDILQNNARKFAPLFGCSGWFRRENGTQPLSEYFKDIDNMCDVGVEVLTICCHVYYDGGYKTKEDLESIKKVIEYAQSRGLKIGLLKFMDEINNQNVISDFDNYFDYLKRTINLWCSSLSKYNIDKCTVLNEIKEIYNDEGYDGKVIELLTLAKNNGYKVGVSTAFLDESLKISDNLLTHIDFYGVNLYPQVSNLMEKTPFDSGVRAFKKYEERLKRLSANKPVVITEIGIRDKWEALSNPSDATYGNEGVGTPSNGQAVKIVLYGILNSGVLNNLIDEVYWWYYDEIFNGECKKLIKSYTGGVVSE